MQPSFFFSSVLRGIYTKGKFFRQVPKNIYTILEFHISPTVWRRTAKKDIIGKVQ